MTSKLIKKINDYTKRSAKNEAEFIKIEKKFNRAKFVTNDNDIEVSTEKN